MPGCRIFWKLKNSENESVSEERGRLMYEKKLLQQECATIRENLTLATHKLEAQASHTDDLNAHILKLKTQVRELEGECLAIKAVKDNRGFKDSSNEAQASDMDHSMHGPGKCIPIFEHNRLMTELEDDYIDESKRLRKNIEEVRTAAEEALDELIEQHAQEKKEFQDSHAQTQKYLDDANEENAELFKVCHDFQCEIIEMKKGAQGAQAPKVAVPRRLAAACSCGSQFGPSTLYCSMCGKKRPY